MTKPIQLHDKTFIPYIPEKEIHSAVQAIASRINIDYKGKQPLVLIVLKAICNFTNNFLIIVPITQFFDKLYQVVTL